MKTSMKGLLVLTITTLCSIASDAQIIYSNSFNGGAVAVNGTLPTVANSLLGGSSGAKWICTYTNNSPSPTNGTVLANGVIATNGGCALLPFTPLPGHIYSMTASLTMPAGMATWVAMGFTQHATQMNDPAHARFTDDPTGYAFINPQESHTWNFFAGPKATVSIGTAPSSLLPTAGTYPFEIILNTLGANWTVSAYANGVQVGTTYTYGANPPIGFAGIGQTAFAGKSIAGIQWNYWTLSIVPRPVITQQPAAQVVVAGEAYTNTAAVTADTGGGSLFCQWYSNGIPLINGGSISGVNSTNLVIDPVSTNNSSTGYYLIVTNNYGSTTSAIVSLTVLPGVITNAAPIQLASPDSSLILTFAVSNFDGSANCPVYSLARNGQTLISASKLGLTFDSGGLLQGNLAVLSETYSMNDSTWQPVYGEKSSIRDNYNQLVVNLQELLSPYRLVQLTFRVYNEGAAFRYTIPAQIGLAGATNLTEQTEFRFTADYPAWAVYTAQGVYSQTTVSGIASGCERPLPVQLQTNLYVALGEAGLVDYSRMKFAPLSGKPYSLVSLLDGPVANSLPLTTPWRFIMAADSPGQLLENDFFVLNLNDPCVLTNTDWIKPGKAIRETTLKTASGKACVDFAVKHKIQYIEFDAGWYGPENSTPTATNAISSLDLPGVIGYANANNVGVILYVNWLAMTNQLSLLPPLYHSWGVKGIKYGFVGVGPQQVTAIVNAAARICASNQMMMEVHDEFRPSGYTRTYPNFMTVEGISGDETTPTASQDTTLFFSRMLAGGADHTVCYFEKRVTNNWSFACQLAKAVCFYSPWQYLYWYDRPTNSVGYVDGGNAMISEVPEMEFYDYLPSVWDETRVLQGSIGQYAIIARRTGVQWFIGAMNANTTRTFTVPLNFLPPDQKYIETVYSQDPSVPTRTHVRIERLVVDAASVVTVVLDPSRGEAIRLLPANPPIIQSLSQLSGGGVGLTVAGDVSLPYSLWTSSDPTRPRDTWMLLNNGLITSNPFRLEDTLTQAQRFYRSSTP